MSWIRKCFCCKKGKQVYVLHLSENKVYVGESRDIERRIWMHENKNGSAWTKKYDCLYSVNPITPQSSFWELDETLEQISIHGIDNVRGSLFTSLSPPTIEEKVMAAKLYCEKYDYCRKCGREGHYITQCRNSTNAEWVKKFGGYLEIPLHRQCLKCSINIDDKPKNYKYCTSCFSVENQFYKKLYKK